MISVQIRMGKDTATPAVAALGDAVKPSVLAKIAAREGEKLYTQHFEALSAQRHRDHIASVAHDFYGTAARFTFGTSQDNVATIRTYAPAGLRQRLLGGTIRAVKARALWIPKPLTMAEGRTPGDFKGLVTVIFNRATGKGVAKLKGGDGAVLFYLRREIEQAPDPSVAPSADVLKDTVTAAIRTKLAFIARRRSQAGADTEKGN